MSPIREDIIMLIRSYDELTEAQKDVDDIILQKDEYLEMFDITKAIFRYLECYLGGREY